MKLGIDLLTCLQNNLQIKSTSYPDMAAETDIYARYV